MPVCRILVATLRGVASVGVRSLNRLHYRVLTSLCEQPEPHGHVQCALTSRDKEALLPVSSQSVCIRQSTVEAEHLSP